jgi:hypothetical protein
VLGSFHAVTVEYRTSPSGITVRVDGKSFDITPPADFAINDPVLQIGPYCVDDSMRDTFDDVAVFTTP